MFTVDGITWNIPCNIKREALVTASEISGQLLDGSYFNDILGTYMQYTISLVGNPGNPNEYNAIYEKLTEPVEAHTFVLPYNQSTIQLTARVESVNDVYVRLANGGIYWKGTEFTIIANHPSKSETLSEVITRGRCPIPEITGPREGDTYTYTNGAWVKVEDEGE